MRWASKEAQRPIDDVEEEEPAAAGAEERKKKEQKRMMMMIARRRRKMLQHDWETEIQERTGDEIGLAEQSAPALRFLKQLCFRPEC